MILVERVRAPSCVRWRKPAKEKLRTRCRKTYGDGHYTIRERAREFHVYADRGPES